MASYFDIPLNGFFKIHNTLYHRLDNQALYIFAGQITPLPSNFFIDEDVSHVPNTVVKTEFKKELDKLEHLITLNTDNFDSLASYGMEHSRTNRLFNAIEQNKMITQPILDQMATKFLALRKHQDENIFSYAPVEEEVPVYQSEIKQTLDIENNRPLFKMDVVPMNNGFLDQHFDTVCKNMDFPAMRAQEVEENFFVYDLNGKLHLRETNPLKRGERIKHELKE
jgi:hypothetical protein